MTSSSRPNLVCVYMYVWYVCYICIKFQTSNAYVVRTSAYIVRTYLKTSKKKNQKFDEIIPVLKMTRHCAQSKAGVVFIGFRCSCINLLPDSKFHYPSVNSEF